MYQSQINVRYAKSLFLLATEKNIIDEINNDINLIYTAFLEIEELTIVVEHPVINPSEKRKIFSDLFKNRINKYTMSFLELAIKNKRENHIKQMCLNFIDLYRNHKGIKKAVLTTAIELSKKEIISIKELIQKKFDATIELQNIVDEHLIGGMIIQVEDKQLDLSVAKKLQSYRRDFLTIDFNNNKRFK